MSDDMKLLPCPFCSEIVELRVDAFDCEDREGTPTRVHCDNCGCEGPWEYERDGSSKCVDSWNRRVEPSPLVWTSERPKVEGKYAVRTIHKSDRDLGIWWVVSLDDAMLKSQEALRAQGFDLDSELEFAGPIPEPQEARP